jgi:hypothetical protein
LPALMLVNSHAGLVHLLESIQLVGVHPDDVIGVLSVGESSVTGQVIAAPIACSPWLRTKLSP